METVYRTKTEGKDCDVTVYSGQMAKKTAIRAQLIAYPVHGATNSGVTELSFIHPRTGAVLDTWNDMCLSLKSRAGLDDRIRVFELPTMQGYLSKVCILARGIGMHLELRLETNGSFHPQAQAGEIRVPKHFYLKTKGLNDIAFKTFGTENIDRIYLRLNGTHRLYDRIMVSKTVDFSSSVVVNRTLADQKPQKGILEVALPKQYPVNVLSLNIVTTLDTAEVLIPSHVTVDFS